MIIIIVIVTFMVIPSWHLTEDKFMPVSIVYDTNTIYESLFWRNSIKASGILFCSRVLSLRNPANF